MHRAKQNGRRLLLLPAYSDHDVVFCRADGAPWHPRTFSDRFEKSVARTEGIPRVRFHDLRHTSATLLLTQGIATKVVSERLGHATTALTTETYQHIIAGMDEDAAVKSGTALREARARLTLG